MEQFPGCTVLWEMHPAGAQNKSLISDTDLKYYFYLFKISTLPFCSITISILSILDAKK